MTRPGTGPSRIGAPDDGGGAGPLRGLLVLLFFSVMVTLVPASMVNTILPTIGAELAAGEGAVAWVITGNLLAVAAAVPLGARAADVFGVRRTYLAAMVTFSLGSLLCAIAPGLDVLIAGRVLQGAGEGVLPALAIVAVTRVMPPGRRGPSIGFVLAGAGIGATVGPIAAGISAQVAGWRAPFLGVLAAGVLVLLLAARRMPAEPAPGRRRRLDVPGGLLLGGAVALGLLAVTLGAEQQHPPVPPLLVAAGAVVALALLALRLRTASDPLFPPRMLANPAFVGAACVGLLAQGVNVTLSALVPLLLAQVGGLGAGALAGVLAPGPLTAAVVSPLSGRIADRVGAHWPVGAGLVLMLAATLWLSSRPAGTSPLAAAIGVLLLGCGFGLLNAPLAGLAAAQLPPQHAGAGIGVYQSAFFLGGAIGPILGGAAVVAADPAPVPALNPLSGATGLAATYSDVFLTAALPLVVALVVLVAAVALFGNPTGRHGPHIVGHGTGPGDAAPPGARDQRPAGRRTPPHPAGGRPVRRPPDRRAVRPPDGRGAPVQQRSRTFPPDPRRSSPGW